MPKTKELKHIAFIMDGNGRWATSRRKPRLEGHRAGVDTVRNVIKWCKDQGVECVTFYAFSVENWKRSQEEVSGLMALFRHFFKKEMSTLDKENVKIRFIGDRSPLGKLSDDVREIMNDVERDTLENTGITATFAINYGGRDEILRAAIDFAQDAESGRKFLAEANEIGFGEYLDTADLPEVDMIIRTGGEKRLSNFLLWQASYAELAFCDAYWPDFCEHDFDKIVGDFLGRDRKFGKVSDKSVAPHMETGDVEMF